jgi:aspartyl-tRNA(Asn)/glutamyl-tRNA(Gln) amidotransferase subunit B
MQRAREVYADMLDGNESPEEIAKRRGISVEKDPNKIREIVCRAIAANPKAVADFKKGKLKAADAIKGFVMKETRGSANTELVQQIVTEELHRA